MILQDRVDNRTLAVVGVVPARDREGADVALVIARLALAFSLEGELGLAARPLRLEEVPDAHGGVWFPSDVEVHKPGTDVGLVGHLRAPHAPTPEIIAALRLGATKKALRVSGPRVYERAGQGVTPGAAAPLRDDVPLVYALAFGGRVSEPGQASLIDEANPLGVGVGGSLFWVGRAAPRLTPWGPTDGPPQAATFAPRPLDFAGRARLAGTYDATWARTRAPLAPADRDPGHASWASEGLHAAEPLETGRPLHIGGVYHGRDVELALPPYPVALSVKVLGATHALPTHLDGVLVDADRQVVELTFRGHVRMPRKLAMIESVHVTTGVDLPDAIVDAQLEGHPEIGAPS